MKPVHPLRRPAAVWGQTLLITATLLMAALQPASARADGLAGVWSGTLGTQKIMLCINGVGDGNSGSYYFQHSRRPIHIGHEDGETGWTEHGKAQWQFGTPQGDGLTAQWLAAGQPPLPVALQRVHAGTGDDDYACGSDAYAKPLEAQLLHRHKPQVFGGHHFEAVGIDADDSGQLTAATIQLPETSPAAATINADLRTLIPQTTVEITEELFDCRRQTLGTAGESGIYRQTVKPLFWNAHFLTVMVVKDGGCGGPHPFHDMNYRTWNLDTGVPEEAWNWFVANAADSGKAADALNALIRAHAGHNPDPDCVDATTENRSYILHPSERGVVFSSVFPPMQMACDENIEIPYASLAPFLSSAGRTAVAQLEQRGTTVAASGSH